MMITEHIAAGIMIGNFFSKSKSKKILAVSIISSVLADLPVLFFGGPGEINYLSHRIYTHSIILSPIYALIPILLISIFFKNRFKYNFINFYLISFLAFLSHIFIDLVTPYGVQLFYPLSNKIYSLDLFHAFDPLAILISIAIISVSIYQWLKNKHLKKSILVIFSSIILLYTFYTISVKFYYHNKYSTFIEESKRDTKYLATVPRTFWRWKGIAIKNQTSYIILRENDSLQLKEFKSDSINNLAITTSNDYVKFKQYARYPITSFKNGNYSFFNLIYSPKSYKLTLILNNKNEIKLSYITNFDLLDNH